jgi:hypothetical protein
VELGARAVEEGNERRIDMDGIEGGVGVVGQSS